MNYKALMSDIDGTLIPYNYEAFPSQKVVEAIQKAKEKAAICLVTGRAYDTVSPILKRLDLTKGYVVLNNGANVLDIETNELLYDQPIETEDLMVIAKVLHSYNIHIYYKSQFDTYLHDPYIYDEKNPIKKSYMFYAFESFDESVIDEVFAKLSHLSQITTYKTHHNVSGKVGINITHVNATKMHGVEVVMKKLGLKKEEIIGVGDSYNDFALLMASGLKVAMGNAIADLKEVADYVAPSVNDDGLADVIEKFILS